MNRPPALSPPLERFLADAARLTVDDWTTVYWRYVESPAVLRAIRKIHKVTTQAFLDAQRLIPIEQKGTRDPVVTAGNVRMNAIVAPLPDTVLDPRGDGLGPRVKFLLVHMRQVLDHVELLDADPTCRKAVRTFLAIFDGLIAFPEL